MSETVLKIRLGRAGIGFLFLLLCLSGKAELNAQYSSGNRVQPKIWSQPESVAEPRLETLVSPVSSEIPRDETERNAGISSDGRLSGNERNAGISSDGSLLGNVENVKRASTDLPDVSRTAEPRREEKQNGFGLDPASWFSSSGIQGSALTFLFLSAVSLAPAFLMMTTSFVRIFVVFGILRHGFGTQGIPGTQVLAALSLFMTFFIMFPTWEKTWNEGIKPYRNGELSQEEALKAGLKPLCEFMARQLERTGNTEEILLFWRHSSAPPDESRLEEYSVEDVPLHVLLPSFMLSELKTAFLIGVQVLIPMLVVDLLVSSILVSMGMFMLPPTMVSLPFKLLLFVLADGWRLVVEMLLSSF